MDSHVSASCVMRITDAYCINLLEISSYIHCTDRIILTCTSITITIMLRLYMIRAVHMFSLKLYTLLYYFFSVSTSPDQFLLAFSIVCSAHCLKIDELPKFHLI